MLLVQVAILPELSSSLLEEVSGSIRAFVVVVVLGTPSGTLLVPVLPVRSCSSGSVHTCTYVPRSCTCRSVRTCTCVPVLTTTVLVTHRGRRHPVPEAPLLGARSSPLIVVGG